MDMALIINLVAAVLTLCVLSRIVGDNPLFRVAQYLFVGVSLGYAFVVLYHQVLVQDILNITANLNNIQALLLLLVPFVLGLLLIPRIVGQQAGSWLANIPLGLLFGAGAAIALVGALVGTLYTQILATIPPAGTGLLQLIGLTILALGVVATLSYFYFTARRERGIGRIINSLGKAGYWLLMLTFGFFFAGALVTYLTALSERFEFLIGLIG